MDYYFEVLDGGRHCVIASRGDAQGAASHRDPGWWQAPAGCCRSRSAGSVARRGGDRRCSGARRGLRELEPRRRARPLDRERTTSASVRSLLGPVSETLRTTQQRERHVSEPRYPYVHVDVTPEMVDETSALLFELGAEGVEERDEGTLAKSQASGKVTLVAAFPTREEAEQAIAELGPDLAGTLRGDRRRRLARRLEGALPPVHHRAHEATGSRRRRPPAGGVRGEGRRARPRARAWTRVRHRPSRDHAPGRTGPRRSRRRAFGRSALRRRLRKRRPGASSRFHSALQRVVAIDIDPESIDVTRGTGRNALSDRVDASTARSESTELITPVVVANIEARVLIPMAPELVRCRVAAGGLLAALSASSSRRRTTCAAYHRLRAAPRLPEMGEWMLLALRKRA